MAVEVIKRGGERPSELFQASKLHGSVLAACIGSRTPEGQAEQIAQAVSSFVQQWADLRHSITSHDIRRMTHQGLNLFHPDAAYEYQQHELVL